MFIGRYFHQRALQLFFDERKKRGAFLIGQPRTVLADFKRFRMFNLRAFAAVQLHELPAGVGSLSGIALDCAVQEAWVSSTSGTVFQLGEVPCGVPTSVETEQPTAYRISSVYPNPFTTDATITVELDRPQHARITVYDVLGRLVEVVHDGPVQAGEQPFTLSGASLPAGTYLVRLQGENFLYTQRVSRID